MAAGLVAGDRGERDMSTPREDWLNAAVWALAAGRTVEEAIAAADGREVQLMEIKKAAAARFNELGQRKKAPPNLFDSLEDADAHDYEIGAEIGVRSHSEGVRVYTLMETDKGDRFWRLTNP